MEINIPDETISDLAGRELSSHELNMLENNPEFNTLVNIHVFGYSPASERLQDVLEIVGVCGTAKRRQNTLRVHSYLVDNGYVKQLEVAR